MHPHPLAFNNLSDGVCFTQKIQIGIRGRLVFFVSFHCLSGSQRVLRRLLVFLLSGGPQQRVNREKPRECEHKPSRRLLRYTFFSLLF